MAHWRAVTLTAFAVLVISAFVTGCADEVDVDDLWKTMPHPDDVALNGSIQQIATALGEMVELPADYGWTWEEVEEDWDGDDPLVLLSHGLLLERHGRPGDGGLPRELVELVNESLLLPLQDFDRYAVQNHRIVLLSIGPEPRRYEECAVVAFLADVRLVTGGGQGERWRVMDATTLEACGPGMFDGN